MNESTPHDGAVLTPVQQAVADHFREGGSITAVLAVFVILAVVVLAVAVIYHYQQQKNIQSPTVGDPHKLFDGLMHDLALPPSQRELLAHVAKDLHLEHPAVLLMSCRYYDASMTRWVRSTRYSSDALTATQRSLMDIRTCLYPHG